MLSDETTLQQNNERLRVQFAQMANQIGQWIEGRTQKMADIGLSARGTLEDQLQELRSLSDEIENFKEHILEVNNVNNVSIVGHYSMTYSLARALIATVLPCALYLASARSSPSSFSVHPLFSHNFSSLPLPSM